MLGSSGIGYRMLWGRDLCMMWLCVFGVVGLCAWLFFCVSEGLRELECALRRQRERCIGGG